MTYTREEFTSAPDFTTVGGTLSVSGGRLRPSSTGVDSGGYSNTDMGDNDHYVEASLITTADTTDVYHSIIARWDGIDTNSGGDGYVFQQNFADAVLYSANSGSFVTLATIVNAFSTPGAHTMRLEVDGTSITAKIDGAHISGSPFTSSAVATGTKVGVNMYSASTVADSEFDWWEAGTLLVTGTIAVTDAADTSALAGTETFTGTIARTDADDSTSMSGSVAIAGAVAVIDAGDISAMSGVVSVIATPFPDSAPSSGPVFRGARSRRRYYVGSRNPVTGTG